jgi:hypothetical protein
VSDWSGLAARARGLRVHVLTPERIAGLGANGLAALADALAIAGTVPAGTPASAAALDLAATRSAADRIARLARWAAASNTPMTPLVTYLDLHTIRALLRGAAAGSPSAARLATAVPTLALPRRVLERAARLDAPSAVATLLLTIGHPVGAPLARLLSARAAGAATSHVPLLAAEHALAVAWAAGAMLDARHADEPLQSWVRDTATLLTLGTAFAIADGETLDDAARAPIAGTWPMPADALQLARAGRAALRDVLTPPMQAHRAVQAALAAPPGDEEAAAASAQLAHYAEWARREPLSSAPVVHAVLALHAERAAVAASAWRWGLRKAESAS